MTLQTYHNGLLFDPELIQSVQDNKKTEPTTAAIDFMLTATPDSPLAIAQLAGLRYQFLDDKQAGQLVLDTLQNESITEGKLSYLETLQHTLAWLSVVESVRLHPAWGASHDNILEAIHNLVSNLSSLPEAEMTLLDKFWLGALNIGAAVVYENEKLLKHGREIYQAAVDHHIHPEGYLKGLVDAEDVTDTYQIQVSGTCALVLAAEMAERAGVDLWSIENRGITPITATTYLMYYYYYPDKWKWETDLTSDLTETIIKSQGAFIEIVNRRSPIRGIDIMLEDHRPLFSTYYGGLATLTHGTPAPSKKKRWGLFG